MQCASSLIATCNEYLRPKVLVMPADQILAHR